MELDEMMRLIWQGLINVPEDAPERRDAIRAYGALTSELQYEAPKWIVELGGKYKRIRIEEGG